MKVKKIQISKMKILLLFFILFKKEIQKRLSYLSYFNNEFPVKVSSLLKMRIEKTLIDEGEYHTFSSITIMIYLIDT